MRFAITFAAVALGALVIFGVMGRGDKPGDDNQADTQAPQQQTDSPAKPPAEAGEPAPPATADNLDTHTEAEQPELADASEDAQPAGDNASTKLRPRYAEPSGLIDLGSNDPNSNYELFAQIDPYRAGIHQVALTHYSTEVNGEERYVLLEPIDFNIAREGEEPTTDYPTIGSYAAKQITINGTPVLLAEQDAESKRWLGHWDVTDKQPGRVTLSLTIRGGDEQSPVDIARITRTFVLDEGSYTIELKQQVENLTDRPLTVKWEQYAQGDVFHQPNDYLRGRSRHYVVGYFDDDFDPDHFSIYADDGFIARPDLVGDLKNRKANSKWQTVWPNPQVDEEDKSLAWLASLNRYFAAVSSADIDPAAAESADIPSLQAIYPTITTSVYPSQSEDKELDDDERLVLFSLTSRDLTLAPRAKSRPADLSLDLFAGPRRDDLFAQTPYSAMHFEKTIRYSLGGFCGFCTFQWLAHLLLGFLELLHAGVFDWGVAIIILVLVVRVCLHPLTKRGQIGMMKMGKQIAAVQPELEKLKKKFADDPQQLSKEQWKLYQENGINPAAGAVGCLPMLLQTPIWVALYAMLYYAIELRHEPAFYGLFQQLGGWPFLADLARSDRFIPLGPDDGSMVLNLLFIRLDYSAINILPMLMAVTFFFNMKFTTPPPMNEQQAAQQRIMRFMPFIFPIFLYSAPSGLTLYICASTFAGIIDSYIVRKHVKELEASGELLKPKPRKPGGFMDRMRKAVEAQAQRAEELKKKQQDPQNRGPQQYKKRKR